MEEEEMMQNEEEQKQEVKCRTKENRTEPDECYFFVKCLLEWSSSNNMKQQVAKV